MKTKKPNKTQGAREVVASFNAMKPAGVPAELKKYTPRAKLNARIPLYSSAFDQAEPCADYDVAEACIVKGKRVTKSKLGVPRSSSAVYAKACKRAGGKIRAAYKKPVRPEKTEVLFLSPAQAARVNTEPGPNMRFCVARNKRGVLVPLREPEEAQVLQREFAACVRGKRSNAKHCAEKLVQKRGLPMRLGGMLGGLLGR